MRANSRKTDNGNSQRPKDKGPTTMTKSNVDTNKAVIVNPSNRSTNSKWGQRRWTKAWLKQTVVVRRVKRSRTLKISMTQPTEGTITPRRVLTLRKEQLGKRGRRKLGGKKRRKFGRAGRGAIEEERHALCLSDYRLITMGYSTRPVESKQRENSGYLGPEMQCHLVSRELVLGNCI
eukprot:Gb_13030 [translate_table: standard]